MHPLHEHPVYANFQSFAFDYYVYQFVGGLHLSDYIMNQMAVVGIDLYDEKTIYFEQTNESWISQRALELTYTAWDLEPFANDCGYDGPLPMGRGAASCCVPSLMPPFFISI